MPTTFFMLAGEASGDSHAAKLITALKALDADARFVGMGGPKMAAAGLNVAKDLEGMQVVGFWEVARKYGFFRRVFYELLDRVKQERPSALLCVDYPGFNLRFAREVRKLGIPVLYYIVPQVWAWKAMRAKSMAQFVDRAFCVFEFEPPFFEKFGLKTHFVGHPLIDDLKPPMDTDGHRLARLLRLPPGPKTVAFLAGSRPSELYHHMYAISHAALAAMANGRCRCLLSFPDARGVARRSKLGRYFSRRWSAFNKDFMEGIRAGAEVSDQPLPFFPGGPLGDAYRPFKSTRRRKTPKDEQDNESKLADRQQILAFPGEFADACDSLFASLPEDVSHASLLPALADFSVVKSGTSTLEAGLAGNPMCVVYRSSFISYAIARLVVNIPVFSLVNIVLGRYAVPELLQGEVNPARLAQEIERGLTDGKYREQQKAALAELPKKLGGPGASARAAQGIMDFLKGRG